MAFNRKQKLRDNIEAIRTAFILDREQRTATTEERAILQRYCGFGGLKCILNPAKELTDAVRWAKSDLELFAPTVELHRLIRESASSIWVSEFIIMSFYNKSNQDPKFLNQKLFFLNYFSIKRFHI